MESLPNSNSKIKKKKGCGCSSAQKKSTFAANAISKKDSSPLKPAQTTSFSPINILEHERSIIESINRMSTKLINIQLFH